MNVSEPEKLLKTHRLTLNESRNAVVAQLAVGFVLFALSIAALIDRHKIGAGVFGLTALMQFITLPALLKRHRQVEQGLAVYVAVYTQSMRMPQIVSVIVVLVMTVFVGVCSAFIIYVVQKYFNTQIGWTVCGVTLLAVWLFVGCCWYRIATEKRPVVPFVAQEQPEGVWPPAPLFAVEEDNKD